MGTAFHDVEVRALVLAFPGLLVVFHPRPTPCVNTMDAPCAPATWSIVHRPQPDPARKTLNPFQLNVILTNPAKLV